MIDSSREKEKSARRNYCDEDDIQTARHLDDGPLDKMRSAQENADLTFKEAPFSM